ncbi:dUTP diphosphatase [Bacillus benzoevorans]|uniref:Dimeric dUTPase (All-alpha-NTP-PPase superfamily) n=1 Tax=Bacillus benzoevorans TaxID=1456 RepID=A0A7X0LW72_9BACI|nr:dUTP diphosphatase [Bacillus benzoevorans]MBB6445227.1 dimeric dUTPase (all-alpha-NTP-PPase superfamily) [Bacillus benzoevorans]
MNVKKLAEMQKVLDERIVIEHGLEGKDLEENKILALLVEICELANETRCFKHWSTKGPSEQSVLLEEYVDSLHFFLSIANAHEYDVDLLFDTYQRMFEQEKETVTLVPAFKDVMDRILLMEKKKDPYHYVEAFSAYLNIGKLLGFTWEQIEDAYIKKNEINHQRQDKGY